MTDSGSNEPKLKASVNPIALVADIFDIAAEGMK